MGSTPTKSIIVTIVLVVCFLTSLFLIFHENQNFHRYSNGLETKALKQESEGGRIKTIAIIGERNSGTTWMYDHLGQCFNHSMNVERRLSRYKHWFQEDGVGNYIQNDTLVIVMVRNPFDWIEGMRKKPHHATEHMFLDWKEFVEKPWTMDRAGLDRKLNSTVKDTPHACQEHFSYHEVISCHKRPYPPNHFRKIYYSAHQPFYEMRNDGSGKPFDNILSLRAAKTRNFLETTTFNNVKELWIMQYEVVVRRGTKDLIQMLQAATGHTAECEASPNQDRKARNINAQLKKHIEEHLDWDAEALVGYTKTGLQMPKENSTIYKILTK